MTGQSEKLQQEAEFQDKRELQQGEEPRDKFLYLSDRAVALYINKITEESGIEVLVLGCATGSVTPLAKRGNKVIGIDISLVAIDKLVSAIHREGLSQLASAFIMDAESPSFTNKTFDLVCCSGVLHHLDVDQALRAWKPLLREHGRLLMLEPMRWNPFAATYRLFTPAQHTVDEHPLVPSDIQLIRSNFRQVTVEAINLLTPLSAPLAYLPAMNRIKSRIAEVLSRLDSRLLKTFPWLSYFAWSVVIDCRSPIQSDTALGLQDNQIDNPTASE